MISDSVKVQLLNQLRQPIVVLDRDYRVVFSNAAFQAHVGTAANEIEGQLCYRITHERDMPCWRDDETECPAQIAFKEGNRAVVIHKHITKGRITVEEVAATPIENGQYVIEEFFDVTEMLELVEGMLHVCAGCKKVRDKQGEWQRIEAYLENHVGAGSSHTMCPACVKEWNWK
jgi:PAS domain-containing protein